MSEIFYLKGHCPCCGREIYIRHQRSPQFRILGLVDSNGVLTTPKANAETINTIYNFWNAQHIIVHRGLTPDMAKAIKAELKNYTEAEIMQAIKNYAEIQHGEQYWFKYAWTLRDFLKRSLPRFLDLDIAKNNYLRTTRLVAKLKQEDPDRYIKGKYGHLVQR